MTSALTLLACKSGANSAGEPEGEARGAAPPVTEATSSLAKAEPVESASESATLDAATVDRATVHTAPAQTDAQLEIKLADLEQLCAALDRDYGDGTLSDYYGKLVMRSDWGRRQKAAGDESITPGRLLEAAVAELSPPGQIDARLPSCARLLDYLDDVE